MTVTPMTIEGPELVATGRPLQESAAPILNRMLRFELAATATYEQALRHARLPDARTAFELNRTSHAARSVTLAQLIQTLGAVPASSGGSWKWVMSLIEGAAAIFHEGAAIRIVHGGEAQALEMYEESLDQIDDLVIRRELSNHIVPEQQKSERRVRELITATREGSR
jgi:rubrerythrin